MAYKVVVEPDVQNDIDNAIEYYKRVTEDNKVLINLLHEIEQAYAALRISPFL